MAINPVPGVVNITEFDKSLIARLISGNTGGVTIPTKKGDDFEATPVFDADDAEIKLGRPDPNWSIGRYTIDEFLELGPKMYVKRVTDGSNRIGGIEIKTGTVPVALSVGLIPAEAGYIFTGISVTDQAFVGSGTGPYINTPSGGEFPIEKGSISIKDNAVEVATDDGEGNLIGSNIDSATIDYETGDISIIFLTPPSSPVTGDFNSDDTIGYLLGINSGAWINGYAIDIENVNTGPNTGTDRFDIIIYKKNVDGTYTKAEKHIVSQSQTDKDGNGRTTYGPDVFSRNSKIFQYIDNSSIEGLPTVTASITDAAAGLDGGVPSDSDIVLAMDEFISVEQYPDLKIILSAGHTGVSVANKIISISEIRFFTMFMLDTPNVDAAAAKTYHDDTLGPNTSYGGMYWPWHVITDKYTGRQVEVPATGHAVKGFLRDDTKAPAGVRRGSVSSDKLVYYPTPAEKQDLVDSNINLILALPSAGQTVMGQRTLQSFESSTSYMNSRRTLIKIEESLANFISSYFFEPINDDTFDAIFVPANNFLGSLGDELEDFRVVIDETNNNEITKPLRQLVLDTYVILTPDAEEILLNVTYGASGIKISELVST
ncbi:MAG TPA: hypothetical protein ENI23_01470 [bacterium]|nr:hypothetical protein [bacterium]